MRRLTVLVAVLALAGCASKAELEKSLAQVQQISAEKDSLLKDVMATSQFIAEVNSELAKAKARNTGKPVQGAPGEMESNLSPTEQRIQIVKKVQALTARLNESESRLAASRKRVQDLTGSTAALTKQLAAYDSTVASFKTIIDNQKAELANLQVQAAGLQTENTQLKTEKVQLVSANTILTEDKNKLTTERNTVFYVIGTKDELLKRHVIEQTGGILGIGRTQIPSREVNSADFTSIDKTNVNEIAFPKPDKAYRIVTRQDVMALETAPDRGGRIKGGLKIKDADKFWSASKYLILIEL